MARQLLKGLTMLMMIVGLALATAAVANGQVVLNVRAKVPFDFIAGNQECRSGRYDVQLVSDRRLMVIQRADGKNEALAFTHTGDNAKNSQKLNTRLVFHKYANEYFLSQIWIAGETSGREIDKSRRERAIDLP